MAVRNRILTEILFEGGWSTDSGPSFTGAPGRDGKLRVPFLVNADNIIYELDGGVHKMGGGTKLNSTAITSSPAVLGLFDYWRGNTSGSPTQKRMAWAGGTLWKEDLDGTWDSLITGLTSGTVPCFSTFDDILIFSTDDGTDAPRSWD